MSLFTSNLMFRNSFIQPQFLKKTASFRNFRSRSGTRFSSSVSSPSLNSSELVKRKKKDIVEKKKVNSKLPQKKEEENKEKNKINLFLGIEPLFPSQILNFRVQEVRYELMIEEALKKRGKKEFAIGQYQRDEYGLEKPGKVATLAKILSHQQMANREIYLTVKGMKRLNLEKVERSLTGLWVTDPNYFNDQDEKDKDKNLILANQLKDLLKSLTTKVSRIKNKIYLI